MNLALTLMVLAVYALHQDFWNWDNANLVFGVLPVGLAYHAGYSLLASVAMWMLVRFAWPEQLERTVAAEGIVEVGEPHP